MILLFFLWQRILTPTLLCPQPDYLSDLVEIVLYFLLPPHEFSSAPLKAIVIEILTSALLRPLLHLLADPDYINRIMVWAVSERGGWGA